MDQNSPVASTVSAEVGSYGKVSSGVYQQLEPSVASTDSSEYLSDGIVSVPDVHSLIIVESSERNINDIVTSI